jgi:ABC-type Fe3+/spermidine/putrescine transport system ATPase subunit
MEKTDSLLLISHVKKSFGTLEVLKDISIDVYKGDVVSILGPSGSGKTTLLRCALADAASISWKGLITGQSVWTIRLSI